MTHYVDTPSRSPLARALRKLLPAYRPSSMGGPTMPPPAPMVADANVTDNGERVVPEDDNFCFQAHLSIYNFAKPYAHGKRVLDAGCGTGYGSFHLLSEGKAKSVHGIDLSEKAIAYCRSPLRRAEPSLRRDGPPDVNLGGRAKFDLIFSSNVLEHVADADAFLATAIRLLDSRRRLRPGRAVREHARGPRRQPRKPLPHQQHHPARLADQGAAVLHRGAGVSPLGRARVGRSPTATCGSTTLSG